MTEDLLVIPIFLAERIENLGKSFFKFLEQRFEKILLLNEVSAEQCRWTHKEPRLTTASLKPSYKGLYGMLSGILFLYSRNPLYGHLVITDSLLCPWGKPLNFL